MKILMIDWGNTQLKFIQCDSLSMQGLVNGQLFCVPDLDKLTQQIHQQYDSILISSVRSQKENEQLCRLLQNKTKELFFAETSVQACGIVCAYEDPSLLGIDRWLGVLAVKNLATHVGLVSIGTAITVDVVSQKKHLGGHILPGRQLMFDSLISTGQVRPELKSVLGNNCLLGKSTSECVNYGIDASISAYLTSVMQRMLKLHQVNQWVFTGGGGRYWAEKLKDTNMPVRFEPLTVFQGLVKLYLDNQKK